MGGTGSFVVREMRHMLPPTVFFAVSFNVLVLTVALFSDGRFASLPTHMTATVAALLCGKAVLIADRLPFFNRYPDRPLAWNVAWKAALYVLVTLVVRLLERLLGAATADAGFAAGLAEEAAAFDWARFCAVQLWLVLLFLAYAAAGELIGQMGRERVMRMFFGPMPASGDAAGPT
jgi:hypothetical protein